MPSLPPLGGQTGHIIQGRSNKILQWKKIYSLAKLVLQHFILSILSNVVHTINNLIRVELEPQQFVKHSPEHRCWKLHISLFGPHGAEVQGPWPLSLKESWFQRKHWLLKAPSWKEHIRNILQGFNFLLGSWMLINKISQYCKLSKWYLQFGR